MSIRDFFDKIYTNALVGFALTAFVLAGFVKGEKFAFLFGVILLLLATINIWYLSRKEEYKLSKALLSTLSMSMGAYMICTYML